MNVILDVRRVENEEMSSRAVMVRVKAIAETIDENLKVTTDSGDEHADGKVPIMDLKVWIGRVGEDVVKVLHTHYMKEVASRATISYRSSHSKEMKRNVAMNEVMRIFRNCSKNIEWDVVAEHVSYYMKRLQYSGYPEEFRQEVVSETLKKLDRKNAEERGRVRRNIVGEGENHQNVTTDKDKWYAKGGRFESVMFVEATPGSELAKRIQVAVQRFGFKIKIVERAGATIKGLIQKSNPFGTEHCERERCSVCQRGCAVDCKERGCVYEYVCDDCGRKYRGQTGRTIFERDCEHMGSWEREEDECPFQRHSNLYHDGQKFSLDIKVLAKCYGKPTKRMITEAVYIGELCDNETMNNRSEWNYTNLAKMHLSG